MPNKNSIRSLSAIVDKMNKKYDGLIGYGFSPGIGRRIVPVMHDGEAVGWKMQREEEGQWVDLDELPFATMKELIEHYKNENK